MFARTSVWTGTPEALDKWDAGVATVRPFVASLDGNAGAFFFIDRAAGRALTLTLWKTEAAAVASDAFADRVEPGLSPRPGSASSSGASTRSSSRLRRAERPYSETNGGEENPSGDR